MQSQDSPHRKGISKGDIGDAVIMLILGIRVKRGPKANHLGATALRPEAPRVTDQIIEYR